MEAKNQIALDFRNNPELAEVFSRKEIGETCTLTIKLQVNSKDADGVKGTIKEIEAEDYEDSGEEVENEAGEKSAPTASITVMPMDMGDEE